MNKQFLIFLAYFSVTSFYYSAAQDSCSLKISLLTCSPGEELYSTFGHSAIRVRDTGTRTDVIFNYGTFDFDDPNFYTKFIRGKLLYFVSVENYKDFAYDYEIEKRNIIEQLLDLSCAESMQLYSALQVNAREENKFYSYDFLLDNCSTRLRDMVVRNCSRPVTFKAILPNPPPTFRYLIHDYLKINGQNWSKLGIDILMGMKVDTRLKNEQAMFLPDYLMKGFDSAVVLNKPLVKKRETILAAAPKKNKTSSPFLFFLLLFLFVTAVTLFKPRWAPKTLRIFDTIFFFIVGAMGLLILFMWFGTNHDVCRNNFNLIWALPTHLPMAFLKNRQEHWVKDYFKVVAGLIVLLIVTWVFIPQQLNLALFPVFGIILLRSWYLGQKRTYAP